MISSFWAELFQLGSVWVRNNIRPRESRASVASGTGPITYLRRQRIRRARSALLRVAKHDEWRSKWAHELQSRAGHNMTLVAMANKTVGMVWAMLRIGENYKIA